MKCHAGWNGGRARLLVECLVCFFIGPVALFFVRTWFAWKVTPIVLVIALICAGWLLLDKGFDRRRLWNVRPLREHIKGILLTFMLPALLLCIFTFMCYPKRFLYFISDDPWLWLVFVVLYPPLACYPQELLFRAFFFHRYGPLFRSRAALIVLSGISFGLAHLYLNNLYAPGLTTLGGMIFAYRYARSGTVVASTVEHGLWGIFLFTIGMGWYFYSGSIR
jgi:uncharacterized protein